RHYAVPRLLAASNGASAAGDVTELIIVPTALSYVRPLGANARIGFGLFTPRANDLILRDDLDAGTDGRWTVAQAAYDRTTHGGVGVGWTALEGLRLGASLLVAHRAVQTGTQLAGGTAGAARGAGALPTVDPTKQPLTVHEVMLHVGSGFYF
ncbi:MAG: hypothetical protein FJ104_14810, partial [Deltaproteobacteria bacterium]|nr:hypothetical protein [Deltaproteobacteria bacterium]